MISGVLRPMEIGRPGGLSDNWRSDCCDCLTFKRVLGGMGGLGRSSGVVIIFGALTSVVDELGEGLRALERLWTIAYPNPPSMEPVLALRPDSFVTGGSVRVEGEGGSVTVLGRLRIVSGEAVVVDEPELPVFSLTTMSGSDGSGSGVVGEAKDDRLFRVEMGEFPLRLICENLS